MKVRSSPACALSLDTSTGAISAPSKYFPLILRNRSRILANTPAYQIQCGIALDFPELREALRGYATFLLSDTRSRRPTICPKQLRLRYAYGKVRWLLGTCYKLTHNKTKGDPHADHVVARG